VSKEIPKMNDISTKFELQNSNDMRSVKVIMPQIRVPKSKKVSEWCVEFSFYDEINGKMQRFRKKKGFSKCKTERQCWDNAEILQKELSQKLINGWSPYEDRQTVIWKDDLVYQNEYKEKPIYNTKKTVAYFSTKFLETKENTAPSSYKTFMSKLRTLREWLKENKLDLKDVSLITRDHSKQFMKDINKKKKKAGKTNNEYIRLFTEFWDFIKKERKGNENIWDDMPKYANDTKPFIPLRKNILEILKKEMEKPVVAKHKNQYANPRPQLWLAGQFMYYCFIRPGELRHMKIRNMNLFEGKIILFSEYTKSKKTRVVDIPDEFAETLITKYKLHNYPESHYVFTIQGEPGEEQVGANYFNKAFARIRNNLGLPKEYKFYGFKHTGAVQALKTGANIKDIQHQMGHSSVEITDEYLKSMVGYESEFFRKSMPKI